MDLSPDNKYREYVMAWGDQSAPPAVEPQPETRWRNLSFRKDGTTMLGGNVWPSAADAKQRIDEIEAGLATEKFKFVINKKDSDATGSQKILASEYSHSIQILCLNE